MAFASAAVGETYNIKNGASDWTSASSYVESALPGEGDFVQVGAGCSVTLDASDSNSWELVESLSRIIPLATNSVLTVNVESLADGATLTTPFSATTTDIAAEVTGPDVGTLVKTGGGNLHLGSSSGRFLSPSGDRFDYYVALDIRNGTLTLPQDVSTSGSFRHGKVSVSSPGVFVTMKMASDATVYPNVSVRTLSGNGTVSSSGTRPLVVRSYRETTSFSGALSGTVSLLVGGRMRLSGASGNSTGTFSVFCNYNSLVDAWWGGYVEVDRFGNVGESSPLGAGQNLEVENYGGGYRFTGSSDSTDKTLLLSDTMLFSGMSFLDGGPYGGLEWTGTWKMPDWNSDTTKTHQLVLMGSNTTECVMSGQIVDGKRSESSGTVEYPIYIIKRGSGTWRMANNASRTGGGGFAIEEGTLRYDSIAEQGVVSALGMSDNLTTNYTGRDIESHRVGYAFLLGSAAEGTMEFTGNSGGICSTRPVAVKGRGRFKVSGSGMFTFSGFSAAEADATLILDTSRETSDIELRDITDGAAPLSVVKDGSGEIALGGCSFTGGLVVSNGVLTVNGANRPYQWFRWRIREKGSFCSRYTIASGDNTVTELKMEEFAIYDASGSRLDKNLTWHGVISNGFDKMTAGSVAQETPTNIVQMSSESSAKDLSEWFDGGAGSASGVWGGIELRATVWPFCRADTPKYWFTFVERLPAGSNAAASFDLAGFFATNSSHSAKEVTSLAIEGSVNGLHWESVVENDALEIPTAGCRWYSKPNDRSLVKVDGAYYYSMLDHEGFAMRGTATNNCTTAIAAPVSVAPNATLAAAGDVSLSAIVLSAAGNGTISGFALQDDGTLEICGVPRSSSPLTIPISFSNVSNLSALANWQLSVNGKPAGRAIKVNELAGTVTLHPNGNYIIIR